MKKSKEYLLLFMLVFLNFIGSIIINTSSFAPKGYRCRTLVYFILGIIVSVVYIIIAIVSPNKDTMNTYLYNFVWNFPWLLYGMLTALVFSTFDESKEQTLGYKKI